MEGKLKSTRQEMILNFDGIEVRIYPDEQVSEGAQFYAYEVSIQWAELEEESEIFGELHEAFQFIRDNFMAGDDMGHGEGKRKPTLDDYIPFDIIWKKKTQLKIALHEKGRIIPAKIIGVNAQQWADENGGAIQRGDIRAKWIMGELEYIDLRHIELTIFAWMGKIGDPDYAEQRWF